MRISVFGLGYVGAVSAACLAADGHTLAGVDTHKVKVVRSTLERAAGQPVSICVHPESP